MSNSDIDEKHDGVGEVRSGNWWVIKHTNDRVATGSGIRME